MNKANKDKLLSVLSSSIKSNKCKDNSNNEVKHCLLQNYYEANNSNLIKSKHNKNVNFRKMLFFNSKPHSSGMNKKLTELLDTTQFQQYTQFSQFSTNKNKYLLKLSNASASISSIENTKQPNKDEQNNDSRITKTNILYKRFVINHKRQSSISSANYTTK